MSKMIIRSLHARKKKIAKQIASLECESCKIGTAIEALTGKSPAKAIKPARKRRKMSAAARKKIAAAQKARWAKWKAENAKK